MPQKFVLLKDDNTARAFLSDEVNEIPPEAIPLTDEQWMQWASSGVVLRWDDGELVAVPVDDEPAVPVPRLVTPRDFRMRFTTEERGVMALAASRMMEGGDPGLQVFLDDLSAAHAVDLDHPEVVAGMDAIVAAGLITRTRANAILAA
jgi:hypothetical protein